jgi:hypothetical protein
MWGAAIVVAILCSLPASADELVRARGRVNDPSTECFSRFEGTPLNFPAKRPRMIRCVDNDPACDADPTPGICAVSVAVRLNVVDPSNPECSPDDLDLYTVQNHQPDTNPRHDFSLQVLQDLVAADLPLISSDTDQLGTPAVLGLPLKVVPRDGAARWGRARKVIRARVDGSGGAFDVDRMRVVCVPDGVSTPCDGITGTFDQVQTQLFSRTCAVPTCHSAPVAPHALSLLPDVSLSFLVGAPPTNTVANAAGKLRVDPGNPANSYLLDKLRGTLASGEGERMPFGLRPVHRRFIEIVEDWIAAGAPEAGFVSATGCPSP